MLSIFLFLVVLALVLFLTGKLRGSRLPAPADYRLLNLLSPAESRFFSSFEKYVAGRCRVFSKPRVADLLQPVAPYKSSAWFRAFNRVALKHVDFVCLDSTGRLICVVELDDSSHAAAERVSRDGFVDSVFKAVGVPVFHFPVRSAYTSVDFGLLDKALQVK